MSLKNKQLLLVGICGGITLLLFCFGSIKTPIKTGELVESKTTEENDKIFKTVEQTALENLKKAEQDTIRILSDSFQEATSKDKKIEEVEILANKWLDYGNPDLNAYYTIQKAYLSDKEKDLLESVQKAEAAAQMSPDSTAKVYFTDKTLTLYNTLESKFPDSLQYSVRKAAVLIDQKQQVMQGVLILRDVIQKDSLNLQANFILGKLSVVSGQHDKAVKRLKTVLRLDAKNTEALYFLGEAYLGLGKKQEAIATFEKCKTMVDSPVFQTEIDKYINNILKQ